MRPWICWARESNQLIGNSDVCHAFPQRCQQDSIIKVFAEAFGRVLKNWEKKLRKFPLEVSAFTTPTPTFFLRNEDQEVKRSSIKIFLRREEPCLLQEEPQIIGQS